MKRGRFFTTYFATLGVCLMPMLAGWLVLYRAHELTAYDEIVALQQGLDAIYGPATTQNLFAYKHALVKRRQPAVLALGSSRALEFRQEAFTVPFVNAGGAMRSVVEGRRFLTAALTDAKPRMLLLTVDVWWFNPEWAARYDGMAADGDPREITLFKVTRPLVWLATAKIGAREAVRVALRGDTRNDVTDFTNLGITALHTSTGFRADGSHQAGLGQVTQGGDARPDTRFETTLSYVRTSTGFLAHGARADRTKLAEFRALLDGLRGQGITPVLVLPPMAPPVRAAMIAQAPRYAFIDEAKAEIARWPYEFYDFDVADPAMADVCEYVDGIHPGEVLYQRMLLRIVERNRDSALAPVVNRERLAPVVARDAGHVVIRFDPARYKQAESDFLELGCRKGDARDKA